MDTPNDVTLEFIKHACQNHVLRIKFTKVNGEDREMKCTLRPEHLPESLQNGNTELPPGLIRVFDLDKNGWRSMYVKSIYSISVEDK